MHTALGTPAIPFTVTARLQQGAALDAAFGTALDGLLASVTRQRAKRAASTPDRVVTGSLLDGGLDTETPAVVDLPLARCTNPDTGANDPDWHWHATTAFPVTFDGTRAVGDPDVHHQHSRIRERLLPRVADKMPATLPPASGRYRLRRMPVVTTPATALIWRAIGDPDHAADLLGDLSSLGRRRGTGEGTVLGWDITPVHLPPDQWLCFAHTHPDQTLGRPTPHACLRRVDLPADREGVAGIRPPYWHPATQRPVLLPPPL